MFAVLLTCGLICLHNELKALLKHDRVTFGISYGIGSPEVSEALGNIGLDWINFDMQHTHLDTGVTQALIQAMSYSRTTPIVRVISNDLGLINRALDIGAHGVIVPLVNCREDAERALRAAKYSPKGVRSWGPTRPLLRDPNYADTADAETMVIPQIETDVAMKNLEDIVSTEGIEAAFVGPMDLSMSLGVFRKFDDRKFVNALEAVVSACEAHDVAPGLLAPAGPFELLIEPLWLQPEDGCSFLFLPLCAVREAFSAPSV
jgi:2-keto-3-deoxy-L-rhamnonate aldolase RhmA